CRRPARGRGRPARPPPRRERPRGDSRLYACRERSSVRSSCDYPRPRMTEFRLLGPLEAADGGLVVALPVGKPSAVLACLLVEANRVVPTDALVDALWGEHPPASSTKLVQAYVSQLRKTLGAAAIETRAP